MGMYVHDGILIGSVFTLDSDNREQVKDNSHKIQEDLESELVDLNWRDNSYEVIVASNNPYNKLTEMYVGFFIEWSTRRAMGLDEMWTPLYLEQGRAVQDISAANKESQEKTNILAEIVSKVLSKYTGDFPVQRIGLSEVRFYS